MKKIFNNKNFIKRLFNNKNFIKFSFLIYFLTRAFVLILYPRDYSDVRQDYERYANMWWYGLPPYLKHLFEYPPGAVPLMIIPLAIDLAGVGVYYLNYHIQTFLIETVLFIFLLKVLKKTFKSPSSKYLAVIFYGLAGMIVKNFWYEGIDIAFTGSLTLALASFFLIKKENFKSKTLFWSLFWLSVAIKFATLPLALPFFLLKLKNLNIRSKDFIKTVINELKPAILGFLIIWGLPLVIFRTSLSVFLFFHAKRPLHDSSFPAFIVYTINHFTKTEALDFLEWHGPLTDKVHSCSFLFLGINIFLVLGWTVIKYLKNKNINKYILMLKVSLIYYIVFSLSGKIFSPPFNIWYVPLLTIFPYKNKKTQLFFFFLGIWSLVYNTTNLTNLPKTIMIYPFTWNYLRTLLRFPPLIAIIFLIAKQPDKKIVNW